MVTFLSIVSVVTAILLTIVILIQNPKSAGGIGSISGGVSEAMFGASAPTALVKITVILAIIFLVSTLLTATLVGRQRERKSIGQSLAAQPAVPVQVEAAPAAPAAEAPATPATEAPAATE